MKIVRDNLYEFHKGTDPLSDLGLGLFHEKNLTFENTAEFIVWLSGCLPKILELKTNDKEYLIINLHLQKSFIKIADFLISKNIFIKTLDRYFNYWDDKQEMFRDLNAYLNKNR